MKDLKRQIFNILWFCVTAKTYSTLKMDRSDDGVTLFCFTCKQIMGEKIATGYIYRLKTKRGHVSMFG